MEFLKKVGEFFKNHYEKVLLSVVLLGLVGAAAYLPIKVKQSAAAVKPPEPATAPVKKWVLTDLKTNEIIVNNAKETPSLNLSGWHQLVNPATWLLLPNGVQTKVERESDRFAGALKVMRIVPLNLDISFNGVTGPADNLRYQMFVQNQANTNKARTGKIPILASIGEKKELFILVDVTGPKDNPATLELELLENNQRVNISKTKPFVRIQGYAADLKYELDGKTFINRREKDVLEFGGAKYNIVAITHNDVTVQAPNGKRTTKKLQSTSTQ